MSQLNTTKIKDSHSHNEGGVIFHFNQTFRECFPVKVGWEDYRMN